MTIFDAYAVVAFLRDEPAAARVGELLDRGAVSLTAVGLAEVVDHLVRLAGADEEDALLDLAQLGLLDAEPVTSAAGAAAGRLRAKHYHRTRCAVSMADCVAAVVAAETSRPLATSDPHLLGVCHTEGIAVEPLVDSAGEVWTP